MLHLLTVIGARPQIIKAAALSRAIRTGFSGKIRELIVHTGQHYDENMSQVFFEELDIPKPDYQLAIGSASHGKQTAAMIAALEEVMLKEKPAAVVLYGDTNSTLAGSVAASKIGIPVVHIEAGLRSFNRSMPEEINRILCDHVSTLLFSPTRTGYDNLVKEGIASEKNPDRATAVHPAVYHCGDIMYDNSLYFSKIADEKSRIIEDEKLRPGNYILATVHRDSNTDRPENLLSIFSAFEEIAAQTGMTIVIPLHPRTRKQIELIPELSQRIASNSSVRILPPASFLDMIRLEKNAALVLTDSGGVQKEAFFFQKPCVILRNETEWTELVECGAAKLAGTDRNKIESAALAFLQQKPAFPPVFGDGRAAELICREIVHHLS